MMAKFCSRFCLFFSRKEKGRTRGIKVLGKRREQGENSSHYRSTSILQYNSSHLSFVSVDDYFNSCKYKCLSNLLNTHVSTI